MNMGTDAESFEKVSVSRSGKTSLTLFVRVQSDAEKQLSQGNNELD